MLAELNSLSQMQLFAFSIWCASRLVQSVNLETDLLVSEIAVLQEVVAKTWSWVGDGTGAKPEQVADARTRVERLGPSEPVKKIEMDPRVVEAFVCVETALDCYLTKTAECALAAAQCLINVIDYERDFNDVDTMLEYPPLRAEFERQLKMIDCLRTATLEHVSLQQLRSFPER
ncbi:MAG TPA: hypothetical protein VF278_02170 [Pirellulales bacterium]